MARNESFFNDLAKQKRQKMGYRKLGDGSLTYFLDIVVLYLEIAENIDQMHKSTFPYH